MADLQETVEQLAEALVANNIALLMPMFTPQGLMQALALQTGESSAEGSDSYELRPQEGNRYEIWFKGEDGEGGIYTDWLKLDGEWKVDGIGRLGE